MIKGISIIICCYNSALKLYETLRHISLQQTIQSLAWEVVIVDNASTDNTVETAKRMWKDFDLQNIPFFIVSEKQQGLSFARKRGVAVAKYEYIVFCDDDNWLNPDYIQTAFSLIDSNGTFGVIGGQSTAVSDVPLPEWFSAYKSEYAVGKPAETSMIFNDRSYLCGAGMVTRKTVFKKVITDKFPSILTDRAGHTLSSGGDVEYCLRVVLQGYNLYYSEDLIFRHSIQPSRLTEAYRIKLCESINECREVISEYVEALNIKKLNKHTKVVYSIGAIKDVLKSILKRKKARLSSYRLLFYLFNIGYKERPDLKIIKHFYNA